MLSISGFQKAFEYINLIEQGMICTLSLSALTVLFGFILALFLAIWVLRRLGVAFETDNVSQTYILQFFATHTPLSALSLLQ